MKTILYATAACMVTWALLIVILHGLLRVMLA